jgi:DtxR family Mn-dependent transcriptional regulator
MKDSIHASKENYLKAILEAEAEGREVIPAVLAHWLEVSAPAVTMALKRLKRDGYVEVGRDGIVRLTATGRETAYRTALRHHLIERMLSEIFGMEWHEIHEEAERLEHAVSPAFESKLREKLGETGACPHGNQVLPEPPAQRKQRGETQLSEAAPGASCSSSTKTASAPAKPSASLARITTKPFRLNCLQATPPWAVQPPKQSGSSQNPHNN